MKAIPDKLYTDFVPATVSKYGDTWGCSLVVWSLVGKRKNRRSRTARRNRREKAANNCAIARRMRSCRFYSFLLANRREINSAEKTRTNSLRRSARYLFGARLTVGGRGIGWTDMSRRGIRRGSGLDGHRYLDVHIPFVT